MKAKYLALSLLACVGMASCSDSDNLVGGDGQGSATSTSYLAVNILNTGSTGSRAASYENGSEAENKIGDIRFYLFKANGDPYTLTGGKSYVSPTYSAGSNPTTGGNVEEIGDAVLVIDGAQTAPPASMVAVANGTSLADSYSLSGLKEVLASDYKDGSGNFTMSNSVYVDGGKEIDAVSVEGHVTNSEESAKANPVDIYIERLAAKVKVSFSGDGWSTIDNKPAYLVSGTAGQTGAVYAQVQGWTLVSVPDKTHLLKDIDPSWTNDDLGYTSSSPWNSADYHRSFWAQMPASGVNFNTKFTPGDITSTAEQYTLENTSDNNKTQLLVITKLVDKDGNAVSRYVYLGDATSFTSESDILTEILSVFNTAQQTTYYIKTGSTEAAESYTSLAPTNLKFVSGASLGKQDSYKAYAQLNTPFSGAATGEEEKLYTKNEEGNFEPVSDLTTINTALANYYAQIWKDGYSYYFTTVKHEGSTGKKAEFGIVRNHVYDITATEIKGYGTPIYKPSEEIVTPITPGDDYSYLAARVNILSWKVVSSDVTFGD